MTDAGSSTSASPPIPPQNGPPNNSAKPFLGTPRHAIFYGIATASSATPSASRFRIWPSRNSWRHGHSGNEPTWNAVIGTIRRECLDHVIVLNEASLYRQVKSFVTYYHNLERTSHWARTRRN